MKKYLILLVFLCSVPSLSLALAEYNPQGVGGGNPDVHIKADGTIALRSARVEQIAGSTLYIVTKWGPLIMSFTMKTDGTTMVTKRYGGSTIVSQIKMGDYLDIDGEFFAGSDFFGISAKKIKDWSLQEEAGTFSGVITEVNSGGTFTLRTTQNPTLIVKVSTTTTILKGTMTIPFERLQKADTIPLITGVYDYSKNVLTAAKIAVYQSRTDFLPRNFEGTLKQISSPTVPSTLVVTVGGIDYTVNVNEKTLVQKKNKSIGQLARFVAGDSVRFYGSMREEEKILRDALVIDVEVLRNLSL